VGFRITDGLLNCSGIITDGRLYYSGIITDGLLYYNGIKYKLNKSRKVASVCGIQNEKEYLCNRWVWFVFPYHIDLEKDLERVKQNI